MTNPRGNLQCNINKIDCHDSATFDKVAESRNDGNANSHSYKKTHPHPTGCEALAEAKPPPQGKGLLLPQANRHCERTLVKRGNPQVKKHYHNSSARKYPNIKKTAKKLSDLSNTIKIIKDY